MNPSMFITAVIPTKNRKDDLLKAVVSIITQSSLPNELIVVDQSDSNEAHALLLDVLAMSPELTFNYLHDKSVTGLVDAKRAAVARARGDVVCFLEDDIILESDYVQSMRQAFVQYPEMMGCCGVVTNLPKLPTAYTHFFHIFHRGIFHDPRVGIHGYVSDVEGMMLPSAYLSGGTSAYRREVFEKIPFDLANEFFMVEDIDFSVRAAKEFGPERFFINTSAKLAHMVSPINRDKLLPRYQRKSREFICFYKKNRDQKYATFSLIWLLVGLSLEAIYASAISKSDAPLKGLVKGILHGIKWRIR